MKIDDVGVGVFLIGTLVLITSMVLLFINREIIFLILMFIGWLIALIGHILIKSKDAKKGVGE